MINEETLCKCSKCGIFMDDIQEVPICEQCRPGLGPEKLAEWKALADKATKKPWEIYDGLDILSATGVEVADGFYIFDREFIAGARTAVPEMIAEVERLRGKEEFLREVLENIANDGIVAADYAKAQLREAELNFTEATTGKSEQGEKSES